MEDYVIMLKRQGYKLEDKNGEHLTWCFIHEENGSMVSRGIGCSRVDTAIPGRGELGPLLQTPCFGGALQSVQ